MQLYSTVHGRNPQEVLLLIRNGAAFLLLANGAVVAQSLETSTGSDSSAGQRIVEIFKPGSGDSTLGPTLDERLSWVTTTNAITPDIVGLASGADVVVVPNPGVAIR